MGKWILGICIVSMSFMGSGCKKTKNTKAEKGTVSIVDSTNTMNECDQFLRDYEGWVKKYIVLIKRFQENPKDKTIIADYQIMVGQIGQWDNRSRQCIKDSAILKRYVELQEMLNDYAVKVVSR
ncbi:MAG: hypothetical protein RL734_1294 [Bacteroidota bacterium]|jgi:hypothetical protein